MMQWDWNAFLSALGGTAVAASAVGALFMLLVKYRLRLAEERFKTDLSTVAAERQTRFSYLHQKQAELIATLYEKLVAIHQTLNLVAALREMSAYEQAARNSLETGKQSIFDLMHFIKTNKLYFPPTLCDRLDQIELLNLQRMVWMEEQITA